MACNLIPPNYALAAFTGQPIFRLNHDEQDLLTLYNNAIFEPITAPKFNNTNFGNGDSAYDQISKLTELVATVQNRLSAIENSRKSIDLALKCDKLQKDLYMTVLPNLSTLNNHIKGEKLAGKAKVVDAPESLQPGQTKSYADVAAKSATNKKMNVGNDQLFSTKKINKNNGQWSTTPYPQVKTSTKTAKTPVIKNQEINKQYCNKPLTNKTKAANLNLSVSACQPNKFHVLNEEGPSLNSVTPDLNNGFKLSYCTGDLLDQKMDIAINVSEDLFMNKGIALQTKNIFGPEIMHDLKKQKLKIGDTGVIIRNGFHVFIVVTKKRFYHKPNKSSFHEFKQNFISGIQSLKTQCENYNITHLAIPRMGCGEDRLEWKFVGQQIYNTFKCSKTKITVYTLPQDSEKFSITNQMQYTPFKAANLNVPSTEHTLPTQPTIQNNPKTTGDVNQNKSKSTPETSHKNTDDFDKNNKLLLENEEEIKFALEYLKNVTKESDHYNFMYKSECAIIKKKISDFEELQCKKNQFNTDCEKTKQSLALLWEKNHALKSQLNSVEREHKLLNSSNSNNSPKTRLDHNGSDYYTDTDDQSDSTTDSDSDTDTAETTLTSIPVLADNKATTPLICNGTQTDTGQHCKQSTTLPLVSNLHNVDFQ